LVEISYLELLLKSVNKCLFVLIGQDSVHKELRTFVALFHSYDTSISSTLLREAGKKRKVVIHRKPLSQLWRNYLPCEKQTKDLIILNPLVRDGATL
jgi:hypothetical protein